MKMSEKCRNNKHNSNNSDNPLTSRRTDGVKNGNLRHEFCSSNRHSKKPSVQAGIEVAI